MGMFSNNQVRHFYVVNGNDCAKLVDGVITPFTSGEYSTLIPEYIKNAKGEYEKVPPFNAEVNTYDGKNLFVESSVTSFSEISEAPVAGESYRIKLVVDQAFCDSPESVYVKVASVRATSADTFATLATKLATALAKSIGKKDVAYGLFDIEASGETITISVNGSAVVANAQAGLVSVKPVLYHIECGKVIINGVEETWGATEYDEEDSGIPNGYKVAEMEAFYHGERGDIYRGMGYPNIMNTKLKADTSALYDFKELRDNTYNLPDEDYNCSRPQSNMVCTIAIKHSLLLA